MRRYAPLKPSRGTTTPATLRLKVFDRDRGCVGSRLGMSGDCGGALEVDHVRASHGMGMKSQTELGNLVALCGAHHRVKTLEGRVWRPELLEYLARVEEASEHAAHVDPCSAECHLFAAGRYGGLT